MGKIKSDKYVAISAVGIVLLIVVGFVTIASPGTLETLFGKAKMLEIHLYDSEGNEITGSTMSIVEGQEGVNSMSYDVNIENTGEIALDECYISDSSPSALTSSLPTISKALSIGSTETWIGSSFLVEPFEAEGQPVRFEVEVTCDYEYNGQQLQMSKSAYKDVTIESELEGDFEIILDGEGGYGGSGEGFCGDGFCDSDEDEISCPEDCPGEDPGGGFDPFFGGSEYCSDSLKNFLGGQYPEFRIMYKDCDIDYCPYEANNHDVLACRESNNNILLPGTEVTDASYVRWIYTVTLC